jgi:hypothetical protein
MSRFMKIMWAVSVIPLLIGLIMLAAAKSETEYSTDEYWVAKDYHHVYDKYSGEIVDYISEDEKCEIEGDTITVTTYNRALSSWGAGLSVFFGMCTAGMVIAAVENSEWWQNFTDKFR